MKRSIDHLAEAHPSPTNKKIKLWSAADYLVADTLRIIFSNLDLKSSVATDELPLVIETLGRYNKPISIRFKNLPHVNPEHLSQLKKLERLTEFSGAINFHRHNDILSALTGLQSLTTTRLPTSAFSILTRLTKLSCREFIGDIVGPVTQLEELELEDNEFEDSFNKFPNLKQLKAYTFQENCQLTKLESLVLRDSCSSDDIPTTLTRLVMRESFFDDINRVDSYEELTNLKRLKDLSIYVPIKDMLEHFPMLEKCNVGKIQSNDTAWDTIGKMPQLSSLRMLLSGSPSEDCFSRLTNLQVLDIVVGSDVDSIDLSVFSSLVHLTLLRFSGYYVPGTTNYYSLTSLTNLQHLETPQFVRESFANNMASLTLLKIAAESHNGEKHCFTNLTNLVELDLDTEFQVNNCVEGLDKLTHLTRLVISKKITDDPWHQVLKLTGLLYYEEHEYVGENVERLADLTAMQKLTSLEIGDNIKAANLDHLTSLTRLQHIYSLRSFHDISQISKHLPLFTSKRKDESC